MNNPIVLILFYVVIIGGFWWLLMRPQKKEQKRVQLMLSELAVGDTVPYSDAEICNHAG